MLEQELKDIWKNSSEADRIRFDLSRLMIDLKNKVDRLDKAIRNRDIREISASVFGMLLFGYFAYEIPFIVTKLACILAIGLFGYIIYRLRAAQKHRVPENLTLSFREQLVNQKAFMSQQGQLLNSVLYWYVLPPFIMNIIFIMGLGNPADHNWSPLLVSMIPLTLEAKLKMLAFIGAFNAFIVWLNKRAVRKNINPVIREIERVQKQLEAE